MDKLAFSPPFLMFPVNRKRILSQNILSRDLRPVLTHAENERRPKMTIPEAVLRLDEKELRTILDSTTYVDLDADNVDEEGNSVLHQLLQSVPASRLAASPHRRQIVYMLRNAGLDVNHQQQHGDTALHLVLSKAGGDPELCEPLLQCGADMHLKNMNGQSAADLAATSISVPKVTKELFEKYSPGLWSAVATDDIMSVRKLINLWCHVDLVKGCKTLKELALEKGTENIIRLIKDIAPSMRLAHSVLASDVKAVTELCDGDSPVNTEFKNLGDMAATPLFYAIMQNNLELVSALCRKGAKIDTTITFEDDDIPIYFTALNRETDPEVVKSLTPSRSENTHFLSMHYKGKHVLLHCIDNDVSPSAVKYILQQGFPELVALRSPSNLCGREVAESKGKQQYVQIIDEVVHDWCLDNNSEPRKMLALLGYSYLKAAQKDGLPVTEIVHSMETSSNQAKFDTQLDKYQELICSLHGAVDMGDAPRVRSLLTYTGPDACCFYPRLVHSLTKYDGQPTLHRAVLRQHSYIVQLLCQAITKTAGLKVDDLRDTCHRTALHYAYCMQNNKDIINILLDYGASEFTMDKDGRSPMVFRDFRDTSVMKDFLQYHKQQNFKSAEPEPWKCRRPPIQFAACQHHGGQGGHSHTHTGLSHTQHSLALLGGQLQSGQTHPLLVRGAAQQQGAASHPGNQTVEAKTVSGGYYYCVIL